MQYTTELRGTADLSELFYQDFKDTFVCNTQLNRANIDYELVVLSGFQRYFCMQYTTPSLESVHFLTLFYQDFKDTFVCNTQLIRYKK